MNKVLAIIGTAGRGEDGKKLTLHHWDTMCQAAIKVFELEECHELISGGAGWADHVAVELSKKLKVMTDIWLPAKNSDLKTAEYYHEKFSKVLGRNTWAEISSKNKFLNINGYGGFKDRNTEVANRADVFLAMTFGRGKNVKDGGTADTVVKMQKRGLNGYHLDLNSLKLYKIA